MLEPYTITRHVCPRNCYSSCSMLGFSTDGILQKVGGDPLHGYTKGKLCPKGFNYVNLVYHPERIKHPMIQEKRGSGKWRKISWDSALDIISDKIIELYQRYGSHMSLALNKYSGNFGILHQAVEGMFNSLGKTTRAIGSPCWSPGLDAFHYDFGWHQTSDLEDLLHAKTIILWGVNPVWTSIHALPYLNQAKELGATLITIDPVYTATAQKSDLYIQVKPGSDGALALAIAKYMIDHQFHDMDFIEKNTVGWSELKEYVDSFPMEEALAKCGQTLEAIKELSNQLIKGSPVFIWTGFGLQRHVHAGQCIRAINALAAITGNIGRKGSGVHFANDPQWKFTSNVMKHFPDGLDQNNCIRPIDINNFATEIHALQDPPVKFLWISCRNLLTQNPDRALLIHALQSLELIVTVDLFLTPTAQLSDLVLPATTNFEEWDIVSSYWHHWISINQPAIPPYHESKSDLQIAKLLSQKLNIKSPGISSFPTDKTSIQFIEDEFTEEIYRDLQISHWKELLHAPRRKPVPSTAWENLQFGTPSKKIELYSQTAKENSHPPLALFVPTQQENQKYPYRLLITHEQYQINSQFINIYSLHAIKTEPHVLLHPTLAKERNIELDDMVRIYNHDGEMIIKAKISSSVSKYTIQIAHSNNLPINNLISYIPADMGKTVTGANGVALNDTFVTIEKLV
ncbi:molybdopterin-dependent oxidoreductase [Brevibacillus ginsengisoli]|uniref:molybdopterin-dependent oxidoreductase n=1 Tax=Brevibacillus ginsengisoli TaxID=363854 RepID=UPI003CEB6495